MRERRKYVRFPLITNVTYKKTEEPASECGCVSRNISGEGINLYIDKRLKPGEKMELSFILPLDPIPILVEGAVVWTRERGEKGIETGIQFTQINEQDRERIIRYIQRCLTWD
ncbi:MAG: PilZ domain-containing protein [Candidatus Omnitrophota bacterium]|nr:MAG: PilZ domain-containing protein [Candidatus Omnitrophota bacterium]